MCPNGKTIVCAICGKREATTVDHVPPKGLFPKPWPSDLITVPACGSCNNGASVDDEKFRVYMAMQIAGGHPDAKRLWKQHALATLRYNKKLLREVMRGMGRVEVRTEAGLYLGTRTTYLFPMQTYHRVMERTVRGLYYHCYGEVLGDGIRWDFSFYPTLDPILVSLSELWARGSIGNGVVQYRYCRALEEPSNTAWLFQFYNAHWAWVTTDPSYSDQDHNPASHASSTSA